VVIPNTGDFPLDNWGYNIPIKISTEDGGMNELNLVMRIPVLVVDE
jgi:hypothetical protein